MSDEKPNAMTCLQCGFALTGHEDRCTQCDAELDIALDAMTQCDTELDIAESTAQQASSDSADPVDSISDQDFIVADLIQDAPVEATVVVSESELVETEVVNQGSPFKTAGPNPYIASDVAAMNPVWMPGYEDFAARGGAVAALVLGVFSVLGGLLTSLALINAIAGMVLAMWGMSSKKKRMAQIGLALCLLGMVICIFRPALFLFR